MTESNTVSRRTLLAGAGALGIGALGAETAGTTPSAGSSASAIGTAACARPNIVMIMADDFGFSDVGCFGGEIATPNIDNLARDGQRFTQLYTYPVCSPTRAALLTGLYPTQAGLGALGNQGTPEYQGHLKESCVTLAQVLGMAGYRTSVSGKWHISPWTLPESLPVGRGFERSFCPVGDRFTYYLPQRYLDGELIGRPDEPGYHVTEAITDHAIASIRQFAAADDPFFVYVPHSAAHYPLHAWPEDIEPYRGRYLGGWGRLREERFERQRALGVIDPDTVLPHPGPGVPDWDSDPDKDWQDSRMAAYAAMVTVMDRGIGRILATLDELGIADNTLVLFFGDNGGAVNEVVPGNNSNVPTLDGSPMIDGNVRGVSPGPHNTWASYGRAWASVSNTPFSRWKNWVHEGGIATPFIARWPASLPGGGIDHRALHVIDFMPTLLELAGASYPTSHDGHAITPMEGESFATVLTDAAGTSGWRRNTPMFWEYNGNRAVRRHRWKLVSEYGAPGAGQWELYDIGTDRTETRNLAATRPDLVADLAGEWQDWKVRVGVRDWEPGDGYRP
ncbi:arylsulfatase [Jiangella asiatica]|uniref:Arylsulfatase n=1 Tax=Jiangella asiatica TaxID=2530372 RepID=A0A4R5DLH1_9ACTN|nr:arylsulfatase [Jiangella asiatica]TDE14277.1 arylsulfatase [Jiangella asiatica]